MTRTVFAAWQSYARDVVPAGAPAVQREECRRAFYAGAGAMLSLVFDAVEPRDEGEGESNLQELEDELTAMSQELRLDERSKGTTR